MNHPHDHAPYEFNRLLDDLEATVQPGNPEIEVTVAVPLSSATLSSLAVLAAREGKHVADVVADALRAAAAWHFRGTQALTRHGGGSRTVHVKPCAPGPGSPAPE